MTDKGLQRAADTCRYTGIDALVIIGGDGSLNGALRLSRLGVKVAGIPGTIDNDVGCTSYTVGFDTACNTAIEAVDKLNDTMQSHERCSVVEVMGRSAGHLALYVGIATGATVTLIPEVEMDFERDVIERIRHARFNGSTHFTVIVAEGAGHVHELADKIISATGIDTRVTTLGHVQRGGKPLVRDRVAASRLGYRAVMLLASGDSGKVVAIRGRESVNIDLEEALKMAKKIDGETYKMLSALMN
jgi:6-phosphofructokinase 1